MDAANQVRAGQGHTLDSLRREYRPSMGADILHAWAADVVAVLAAQPSPGGQGDAPPCWWIDHGTHGQITQRQDEADAAVNAGKRVVSYAARQPVGLSDTFQHGVSEWMDKCFLPSLYSDMTERGDRLLEEVLELLQAHGYDKARVPTLVDYVFSRPVGDPAQEVGGVMVTLAGYCWVAGLDMHVHGHAELARISHPEVMAKIRAKQEAKNALHFDTPLPGNAAPPAQAVPDAVQVIIREYLDAEEAFRAATRNNWGPDKRLSHADPLVIRLREARVALRKMAWDAVEAQAEVKP